MPNDSLTGTRSTAQPPNDATLANSHNHSLSQDQQVSMMQAHAVPTQFANINLLWGHLMLEALSRHGIEHVCLAPGSRSTPLTLATAAHPQLIKHTHFDERGLGFMALGLAKASGKPVVVIVTSGTAVANLYPAIIEAAQTQVPLIVLSADRPTELIHCGANQAIIQPGIFAHYPVFERNIPEPTRRIPSTWLVSLIDEAVHTSLSQGGPAHLNCMYPEPLYPDETQHDFSDYLAPLAHWQTHPHPYCQYQHSTLPSLHPDWHQFAQKKGVIVAGQIDSQEEAQAIATLAMQLGWPLLADLQSQLKSHLHALDYVDLLLLNPDFQVQLAQAEVLLQFGGRLISKRLQQWSDNHAWQTTWQVTPYREKLDPGLRIQQKIIAPLQPWCEIHQQVLPAITNEHVCVWGNTLYQAADQLHQHLEQWSLSQPVISEISVCRSLPRLVPEGSNLFVGNSMPIRLMEMLAEPNTKSLRIDTNRGTSGIDGLIATAYGCQQASLHPAQTLLLGDLSFLHDLNSLHLLSKAEQPFVLILLNNDGGSIFRLLPVPEQDKLLDQYYQLPHGLTAEAACQMFGLHYCAPTDQQSFELDYQHAIVQPEATVIEIQVPQAQASDMLKALSTTIRTCTL